MSKRKFERQRVAHHTVLSLHVTGGFLADTEIELVDGLNCFIGGRGAGKTTTLEFLRFGLGLMPDPKTNPARHRAINDLVTANLGGEGRISIKLRTKSGIHYTANRSANDAVEVLNENDAAVPISLDRDLIFTADVFSQNEIEDMATNPSAQLVLLDRFQEEETAVITRELEQCHRKLEQSGTDLRHIDQEIDDLRSKATELAAFEERLKGLTAVGGPNAEKLNRAHTAKSLRAREAKLPELILAAAQKTTREIAAAVSGFQSLIEAQLDTPIVDGPNKDVFRALQKEVESFETALGKANGAIARAAREMEDNANPHTKRLAEHHAVQEAEYRTLVAQSEQEGGKAAERAQLQTSLAVAEAAQKEQHAKERQRQKLLKSRGELLKQVSELRDKRFALRKHIAERLTKQLPNIRVTVTQATNADRYRQLISEAVKGTGVKQGVVAEKIAATFPPTELAEIIHKNDVEALSRASYAPDRARKLINALRDSGTSYEIEAVDLDDVPSIELLDGDTYKASGHLSTGQRCTTILPILLVQSERPLLIDQPEDNLDNAFVFETIVAALQAVKGDRQIIFVTHNRNIPVLGDAERVFVFGSDGQHASVRQVGTVDECKDQIERILEGGRDAFLQRKKRYGH